MAKFVPRTISPDMALAASVCGKEKPVMTAGGESLSVLAAENGKAVPAYVAAMARMPERLRNASANEPYVMTVLHRIYHLKEMG